MFPPTIFSEKNSYRRWCHLLIVAKMLLSHRHNKTHLKCKKIQFNSLGDILNTAITPSKMVQSNCPSNMQKKRINKLSETHSVF